MFFPILRWLIAAFTPRRCVHPTPKPHGAFRHQFHVEALEDRTLLASPEISPIDDLNLFSTEPASILLNATDFDGDPITYRTNVGETIDSSGQQVVPATANIEVVDGKATLTIDPIEGFLGVFDVTVAVQDRALGNQETFRVTVAQPPPLPTIPDLPNQFTNSIAPVIIQFTTSAETELLALNPSRTANLVSAENGESNPIVAALSQFVHALDQQLQLVNTGNLYENWDRSDPEPERWLRGVTNEFGNPWYFIETTGDFFAWDGSSAASGALIDTLDPIFFDEIQRLYAPHSPASVSVQTIGNTSTVTIDPIEGLEGTFDVTLTMQNTEVNAQRIGAAPEQETFQVTVGRTPFVSATGQRAGDPNAPFSIPLPSFNFDEGGPLDYQVEVRELVNPLDQDLQLINTGNLYENWDQSDPEPERWLRGVENEFGNPWYFIEQNGQFFAWDGSPAATGKLLATLDSDFYDELQRVYSPYTPATAVVQANDNQPTLVVTPIQGIDGTFEINVIATNSNQETAEQTFQITINQPPTVSSIANENLKNTSTLSIPLSVSDATNRLATSTVTVSQFKHPLGEDLRLINTGNLYENWDKSDPEPIVITPGKIAI